MDDAFSIDLEELSDVVGDLVLCEGALHRLADDIVRQMAELQAQWDGLAGTAQQELQAEWDAGMAAVRKAVAGIRAAADLAHHNYTGAADANLQLWRRVR